MSITAAFANLNNAIRGIRTDRERHEERMEDLRIAREKQDYIMNDPREQLARAQAAEQMQIGQFDTGLSGKPMTPKDREHFNTYILPAINDVIPQETELNNENQLVWKGTNTRAEFPKWKRDAIRADIDLGIAMANIGNNKFDMELDNLRNEVATMESDIKRHGEAKSKITQMALKTKRNELAKLEAEAVSPTGRLKRLMSTNMELNKMYRASMKHPNLNPEVFKRMEALRELNNQEIKNIASLLPDPDKLDLQELTYTRVDPQTGVKTERTVLMNKLLANQAPITRRYEDGEYRLGKVSNLPGEDSAGRMTEPQINKINRDVTKAKVLLSVAHTELDKDKMIEKLVESDMTPDEATEMATLMSKGREDFIAEQTKLLDSYKRYEGQPWFVGATYKQTSKSKLERIRAEQRLPKPPKVEVPEKESGIKKWWNDLWGNDEEEPLTPREKLEKKKKDNKDSLGWR